VVTADGTILVASETENADLFWAVRGAGPGFFGVVAEYTLRLFPAPGAIITSTFYYPLELAAELGESASGIARQLPQPIELTISISAAPPAIADRCGTSKGWTCSLSATAFAETTGTAPSMLSALDGCALAAKRLFKTANLPTPIEMLHDMNAVTTPADHRYLTDTLWTDSSPANMLTAACERFLAAPSSKSILLLSFATGAETLQLPDCAYSMGGEALLICSAMWERPEEDAANAAWHQATMAELDRYAVGHYVGESDIISDPGRAERSYSKTSWSRLKTLREKYDPDGLFHGFFNLP
jgi:FAD/FMN-containing dehydrogenase